MGYTLTIQHKFTLLYQVRLDVLCCFSKGSDIWRYCKTHTHAEEVNTLPSHVLLHQNAADLKTVLIRGKLRHYTMHIFLLK